MRRMKYDPNDLKMYSRGECSRPFAYCVRDGDPAAQHIAHQKVVRVGSVIHQIDDDCIARQRMPAPRRMMLGGHLVERVENRAAREVTEAVIRKDIEERYDLVYVTSRELPDFVAGETVRNGVCLDRSRDIGICEERIAHS